MQIGNLVKHRKHEQYGIIIDIVTLPPMNGSLYCVVYWQCGRTDGLYEGGLELICK